MNNKLLREELFRSGMPKWRLAKLLNISEPTLFRRLRDELPEKEQCRIIKLIRQDTQDGGDQRESR